MTKTDSGATGRAVSITKNKKMQPYMKDIAVAFLDKVAEGKTIVEIAEEENMPTRQTLYRWLSLYKEFGQAYKVARQLSAQSFEEKALLIADQLAAENNFTGTRIQSMQQAMIQYRWSASKRDPGMYGQTPPQAAVVVPIQINTNLDLNSQGNDVDGYSFTAYVQPQEPDDTGGGSEASDQLEHGDSPCYDPNGDVDVGGVDPYNAPASVGPVLPSPNPVGRPKGIPQPKRKLGPRQLAKQRAANVAKRNKI